MDLWPYVNGKALTLGIVLQELDASDMLDVIHYLFEEDAMAVTSYEAAIARDKLRQSLYRSFYNREYTYASNEDLRDSLSDEIKAEELVIEDVPTPVDPAARSSNQLKPYIPPTNVNSSSVLPFGSKLDGPLG